MLPYLSTQFLYDQLNYFQSIVMELDQLYPFLFLSFPFLFIRRIKYNNGIYKWYYIIS